MSGWKNRTFRTLSRLIRLAVMLAMQPDANFTRALQMSIFGVSTGTPTASTADDLAAVDRHDDVEVVNHDVEDDVDVEAALRKAAESMDLDEARRADERSAPPPSAGLNRSVCPTPRIAPGARRPAPASRPLRRPTRPSASRRARRCRARETAAPPSDDRPSARRRLTASTRSSSAPASASASRRRAGDRGLRALGDEIRHADQFAHPASRPAAARDAGPDGRRRRHRRAARRSSCARSRRRPSDHDDAGAHRPRG